MAEIRRKRTLETKYGNVFFGVQNQNLSIRTDTQKKKPFLVDLMIRCGNFKKC